MSRNTSLSARIGLAAVVTLVAVGITAGAVFAFVQAFTIDEDATLLPGGLQVAVTGTLQCTPGDQAFVNVFVAQDRGQQTATAFGSTFPSILCDGSVQTWGIQATANSPLKNGPASASANVFTFTGSATAAARLHLR